MKVYTQNNNYVCRPEDDECFLFYNKQTGATCIMNWSAYAVWSKCDGKNTVSDIKDALSKEYSISPDIMHTIDKVFEQMEKSKLIALK